MEVNGGPKSVYFNADTDRKATELEKQMGISRSLLIKQLIDAKHAELHQSLKHGKKQAGVALPEAK